MDNRMEGPPPATRCKECGTLAAETICHICKAPRIVGNEPKFAHGDRIKFSAKGLAIGLGAVCTPEARGTVIGLGTHKMVGTIVRVQFDGRVLGRSIHQDYLELENKEN